MRRKRRSRSNDSSSPIMNMRNTTPSSAIWPMSFWLVMVMGASHGAIWAKAPRP